MKKYKHVPIKILKLMEKIVTYSFEDECRHFEEEYNVEFDPDKSLFIDQDTNKEITLDQVDGGKDHVFYAIMKVNDFLVEV